MNNKRKNNILPQKCYALLPNDGSLVVIIQGTPGYVRSPLDRGSRQENRIIADARNKELGGVSPKQEEAMLTSAIFGWALTGMSDDSSEPMSQVFQVKISRPGLFGANTAATLTLPATTHEILDVLDKARVTDERIIYSVEILHSELEYLPQLISPSVNLYELNYLAQRLSDLKEWGMDCFEGMVMMDAIKNKYAHIAVERLLNMTYSTESCMVAYNVFDDGALGKFYDENDFIPELATLPVNMFKWLDYSKIGKEMREGEGGVFTNIGYVVSSGEIEKVYQSGEAIPQGRPDYTVVVKVTKGHFDDPEYDNDRIVFLKLPGGDDELSQVVGEVEAATPEECNFSAVSCIVPQLTEKISDELGATEGDCYGLVNELARHLKKLDGEGGIPTYKAMLETAPEDITLEEALDLCREIESFTLMREMSSSSDYAAKEIQRLKFFESDEGLEKYIDLHGYGCFLMVKNGVFETAYGLLVSCDGRTVEQCLNRTPEQRMKLE